MYCCVAKVLQNYDYFTYHECITTDRNDELAQKYYLQQYVTLVGIDSIMSRLHWWFTFQAFSENSPTANQPVVLNILRNETLTTFFLHYFRLIIYLSIHFFTNFFRIVLSYYKHFHEYKS